MGLKYYAVQCIINREENPKIALPEEDRATAKGNMHKNLVKIASVVSEMSSWTVRQKDTHTDRHARYNTSQPPQRAK